MSVWDFESEIDNMRLKRDEGDRGEVKSWIEEGVRRDEDVDSRTKYEEAGEMQGETRKSRKNIQGWMEIDIEVVIERLKLRSRISVLELSQQGQPSKHNMVWAGDDATQFLFGRWILLCHFDQFGRPCYALHTCRNFGFGTLARPPLHCTKNSVGDCRRPKNLGYTAWDPPKYSAPP